MMKKTLLMTVTALALAGATWAADGPVTFTKDILPILQENCQTCHRPSGANLSGMIAPMSFMTYEEVRPWARAIAKVAQSRQMPPWHASEATHGVFANERTLTQAQIDAIVTWAETGARRGNPEDAPAPLKFPETGWTFGEPDLVLGFDKPFFVGDEIEDLYHNITIQLTEAQLPRDRWIAEVEFKPGSEVVHHIIGYAQGPGERVEASGQEGETTRGMLGGMAPGTEQAAYPEGFGILLEKGSYVTFAMHYHKESGPGTGRWDSSEMGLKFHEQPAKHPIEISTIAYGPFEIPPRHGNWKVGASRTFEEDTLLLALMPHMHLRGKAAKYTAYYPDGTSELLLEVPRYDFNWQHSYMYRTIKPIPAGTRIEMEFWYDNSQEAGERIGFDYDRSVRFGGPTTDEMDLAWITIAPARPAEAAAPGEAGD